MTIYFTRKAVKRSAAYKIACGLITKCEYDLKRGLTDGERRDFLKDNTPWSAGLINAIVDAMRVRANEEQSQ